MIQKYHPLYNSWRHLRQASSNPNSPDYIGISSFWDSHEFWKFVAYVEECVGPSPSIKHRLVRLDQSKGFEPGNLGWMLPRPHSRLMPNMCILVSYNGEDISLHELADKVNKPYYKLVRRYHKGIRDKELWA